MATKEPAGIVADAYEAVDWGRVDTRTELAGLTYGAFDDLGAGWLADPAA